MITENQSKGYFWKKSSDYAKKTKRLPEIQVLTKDFTSYKIRYKTLRKRK